jgi:D-beta-D-heptose 7-phosphate kinase/D-beta-D-heptose 1-phosphate adenosyltransferase
LKEACKIAGIEYDGYSEGLAQSVASTIRDRFNQTHVFITCGGNGIYTYDGVMERGSIVETHTKNVIDVTGAGDTAIATIALAYCSGKSVKDCALIANLAAGVKVGKRGTDVVFQDEIRNAFLQWQGR